MGCVADSLASYLHEALDDSKVQRLREEGIVQLDALLEHCGERSNVVATCSCNGALKATAVLALTTCHHTTHNTSSA